MSVVRALAVASFGALALSACRGENAGGASAPKSESTSGGVLVTVQDASGKMVFSQQVAADSIALEARVVDGRVVITEMSPASGAAANRPGRRGAACDERDDPGCEETKR